MNKNYKVIYCQSTHTWIAVSELAKSGGKGERAAVSAANPYPLARLTLALLMSLGGVGQQVMAAEVCTTTGGTPGTAVGTGLACGTGASAKNNAVAVGNGASANGNGTAIGTNASTTGGQGTAVGKNATATQQSVAIGAQSATLGQSAVAIGLKASSGAAGTQQTTAIGHLSKAVGDQSTAVGANTHAQGNSSIAIGGDDLDDVASTSPPVWNAKVSAAAAIAANDTTAAQTYYRLTNDILVHYENNPASTVADPDGPVRYQETTSSHGAVAVGVSSTAADLATSFGTRANAYGAASLALGVGSQAGVKNAQTKTIAGVTYTEGDGALANGAGTKAIGSSSVATGAGSIAWNKSDIAIGDGAVAGSDRGVGTYSPLYENQAIAIGTGAQATGKQSISIGTGNIVTGDHSGAFGDPSTINGKNSYSIGNTNTIAASVTTGTFVMGNSVDATVDNSVYLGNDTAVTAGAAVGTANLTSAGVAGATTTAGDTGTVNSATVGGITYGGFAGATANGAVSVGAAGSERRVQNVAAGEISATSTDAINGSQLYSVAKNLGDRITNIEQAIGDTLNVANAGTASAMAMASLPQPHDPGANMVSAAVGAYQDQSALSIGLSSISDNGKWVLKGQVTYDTQSNFGAGLGAGYQW